MKNPQPNENETLANYISRRSLSPETESGYDPAEYFDISSRYDETPTEDVHLFENYEGQRVVLDERGHHSRLYAPEAREVEYLVLLPYSADALENIQAILDAEDFNPHAADDEYADCLVTWTVRETQRSEMDGVYRGGKRAPEAEATVDNAIEFYLLNTEPADEPFDEDCDDE